MTKRTFLFISFLLIILIVVMVVYFISHMPNYSFNGENKIKDYKSEEYKHVMTTLFWIGEEADESNNFISNEKSAWDVSWMENYGGFDSPWERCGYKPCGFEPKENPFYFALPYNDLDEDGIRKDSSLGGDNKKSILKNRWIEIIYRGETCYAQWEDVGPIETDDFDYVFGKSAHKNTFGVVAGLDISPAVWDCLGMESNDIVGWRFVDYSEVPFGPWKEVITTRP